MEELCIFNKIIHLLNLEKQKTVYTIYMQTIRLCCCYHNLSTVLQLSSGDMSIWVTYREFQSEYFI